jgi:bla regulator protein BlaR1
MDSVISSPLLYNLALTLIHFLWQGCLIALALKFILTLTPYNKSKTRYAFSTIAMLSCLIIPIATYFIIYQPIYSQVSTQAEQFASMIQSANLPNNESIAWYQDIFDALPYVSIIWLVIVTLLSSKLFIELYNVNQLPKIGTIEADEKLHQRFLLLTQKINITKIPKLLISLKTDIPIAIGWLKPVILIPASMLSGLSPAQLDMLILHELAHIRRHDYLVNFFQTLIETLLFFHPAVRWISKQIRNEREYCSDDIAVNVCGNPIAYAHTLADTASICTKHRKHAIPTMAMAASGGDLKQRVVRLVDQHHCSSSDDTGSFLASVLIIFSIFLVAIKPHLNSSIIDFSSGRISLFKTANDFLQKKPSKNVTLPKTSIAQLLLTQDNNPLDIKKHNITVKIKSNKQTESSHQLKQIKITQLPLIAKINNSMNTVNTSDNSTKDDVTASIVTPLLEKIEPSKTAILLSKPQEKSLSELAFERTDSANQKSIVQNPYSTQVASLINESITTSEHQGLIVSPDQILLDRQPRFTISSIKPIKPKIKTLINKAAEILSSVDPRYPSTATRKGIEMDVTVNFLIDTEGRVQDIEFEQKSKVSYFRSAIRTALSKWRFLPAQVNGKPAESKMTKIFSFSLTK